MPRDTLSQRIAEIFGALEILRAQSLNHPDKAAEIIQDGLGQLQVRLEGLTALAGGGGTAKEEQDAFLRISWPVRKGCPCRASIFSRRLGPLMA